MSRRRLPLVAAASAVLLLSLAVPSRAGGPLAGAAERAGPDRAGACPPTQAPGPIGPSGTVPGTRPVFSWTAVPGATSYTLYVLRVADEAILWRAINVTSTSATPPFDLPSGVDLRWKVKGESPCGPGPYSPSVHFRIEQGQPLSVRITSPSAGATVSGTVDVTATASPGTARVEFFVDGARQATDTSAPYGFAWNTAANPLPAANHPIDHGYYFVEWKNEATFDQCRAEVNPYTNLYYASLVSYGSDLPLPELMRLLNRSMANAVAEGKKIHLNLELNHEHLRPHLDAVLDTAAAHWRNVVRIELADEPDWSRADLEQWARTVDGRLAARGLPRPPQGYGVTYVYGSPLPDSKHAVGLDWIGIEAYLDFPGSPVSQVNVDRLTADMRQRMSEVPAGKRISMVTMAYNRNGAWTNIDTLRDLQTPVYLLAHDDPRVISINMFSYTRAGGSRDVVPLRTPHRLIAEKALGITVPGAHVGPRTLSVRAFDAAGNSVVDRVAVTVQ